MYCIVHYRYHDNTINIDIIVSSLLSHSSSMYAAVYVLYVDTVLHTYVGTVEPVYYGHLGTSQKCPDYQGVLIFQVSLHNNVSFGTTARCVDYAGVHIFKCPD